MLNYKELDVKFTQLLSTLSKEDLKDWLEFDMKREMLDRLLNGETVTLHLQDFNSHKDSLVNYQQVSLLCGKYHYAMAA